jgi:hypothetical protein
VVAVGGVRGGTEREEGKNGWRNEGPGIMGERRRRKGVERVILVELKLGVYPCVEDQGFCGVGFVVPSFCRLQTCRLRIVYVAYKALCSLQMPSLKT